MPVSLPFAGVDQAQPAFVAVEVQPGVTPAMRPQLLICITVCNEPVAALTATLATVLESLSAARRAGRPGAADACVCLVIDGHEKVDPELLDFLVDAGLVSALARRRDSRTRFFVARRPARALPWPGARCEDEEDVGFVVCIKDRNRGKLHSHALFFGSLAARFEPRLCFYIDCGTKIGSAGIGALLERFACEPVTAASGACIVAAADAEGVLGAWQFMDISTQAAAYWPAELASGHLSGLPGQFSALPWCALGDGRRSPFATELDEWTAERLRSLLRTQLPGDQVIVVSNREPYVHERGQGGIVVKRPASGLVTAVEPVMRACSGTWIAHGSGSADRESADAEGRLRVPPGRGDYTLRRIWLTEEEEQGYYYGFANEGLWPLCHVAHVRPVFRESDWQHYRAINERFAEAVIAEARSEDPVVLVQDYHFALLPALIRRRLPRATIINFWHIPWPNPESFGICPWRKELLEGLLGATILGFHTRFHCKNFLETVDRYLEARIEHEHSTVSFHDDETYVASYPISIEWPSTETQAAGAPIETSRQRVRERLKVSPDQMLAVGVDRFDYTKGILERLFAVERLLEKHPQWLGRFTFLQVAAPSRSSLPEYRLFQQRIHDECLRINGRFGSALWEPVRLLAEHHESAAVTEFYRAADVCVVTSLHDGMNLVCKEFVAARDDLAGVLILSRFAGAACELREALIVNPYHVEETADALQRALTMPAGEQRERMASLRMTVREANVFRWAGLMLADAARRRLRRRIEARVERFSAA